MDQQGLFSLRDSATSSVPVPDAHLASPSCVAHTEVRHTREYGKPSMMTGFTMGPFSEDFEVARKEKLDHLETYLRHLGIVIPPAVDFVEAEINVEGLLDDFMPATIALSGEATSSGIKVSIDVDALLNEMISKSLRQGWQVDSEGFDDRGR
ncbi:hypothetical protein ACCO45_010078 [Purpureocillium lilacinum]|uniref:Uncharacterized protein n=1 Tax=Purpureocillium lilacinum TaxID=33203 RepID=A0ACC4DGT0_PURLI